MLAYTPNQLALIRILIASVRLQHRLRGGPCAPHNALLSSVGPAALLAAATAPDAPLPRICRARLPFGAGVYKHSRTFGRHVDCCGYGRQTRHPGPLNRCDPLLLAAACSLCPFFIVGLFWWSTANRENVFFYYSRFPSGLPAAHDGQSAGTDDEAREAAHQAGRILDRGGCKAAGGMVPELVSHVSGYSLFCLLCTYRLISADAEMMIFGSQFSSAGTVG